MTSSLFTISAGFRTDVGLQREPPNEDWLRIGQRCITWANVPYSVYIVADGMGGHAAGEIASETAGTTLVQAIESWAQGVQRSVEPEAIQQSLVTWSEQASEAVIRKACELGVNFMGTTAVVLLIVGERAYIANVGDSRAYLFRSPVLRQVTQDHSWTARRIRSGELPPEALLTDWQRNMLYRSLGGSTPLEVDTFVESIEAGDTLVLCSDGLWAMVRDDRIVEILRTYASAPQRAADLLIEEALDAGGQDNVSVVVIHIAYANEVG